MEYEISDEPQGQADKYEGDRNGGLVENHMALQERSSVDPSKYPAADREMHSITATAGKDETKPGVKTKQKGRSG